MTTRTIPLQDLELEECSWNKISRRLFNFIGVNNFIWFNLEDSEDQRDILFNYFYKVLIKFCLFPVIDLGYGVIMLRMLVLSVILREEEFLDVISLNEASGVDSEVHQAIVQYWFDTVDYFVRSSAGDFTVSGILHLSLLSDYFPFHVFVHFEDRESDASVVYLNSEDNLDGEPRTGRMRCMSLRDLTRLLQSDLQEMVLLFVFKDDEWKLCIRKALLPRIVTINRYVFYGPVLLRHLSALRSIFNYVSRRFSESGRIPSDFKFERTWLGKIRTVYDFVMNGLSLSERQVIREFIGEDTFSNIVPSITQGLNAWLSFDIFDDNGNINSSIPIAMEEEMELVFTDRNADKDNIISSLEDRVQALEAEVYVVRQDLSDLRGQNRNLEAEVDRLNQELSGNVSTATTTATTTIPTPVVSTTSITTTATTTTATSTSSASTSNTQVGRDVNYYTARMLWRMNNAVDGNLVHCFCGFNVSQRTAFRHYDHYQEFGRCTNKRVFKPRDGSSKKRK